MPAKNSQQFAQLELVHEGVIDVARSLVSALGGPKIVGPRLFPQKAPEAAARYLLDCLNPDRAHDLGLEGFVTLMRWARDQGVHLGLYWLCDELGYARPAPVDPEDARAELQRQVIDAVNRLEVLTKKLAK